MPSLQDKILQASKRQQPYINLTNEKYPIYNILDDQVIDLYNKINIKSLYFYADKLELNNQLGSKINKLITKGIREIFIFCEQESGLTKESFNNFLSEHKIYINIRIAQLTETDIEQIKADSIGKKDILGFAKIENYQIIYDNDWKVDLLNSPKSDQIILDNHKKYKQKIAENFEFGVKEPQYITSNDNPEVRITKIVSLKQGANLEAQLELEVSQNIDVNLSTNQEVEQENELDIDLDQLTNKFNGLAAYKYIKKWLSSSFQEEYLYFDKKNLFSHTYKAYKSIDNIFGSNKQIEYITKDALDLIAPHLHLFAAGISLENMPIGLAFKDGIIFASEQRPASMPINEFTINLKYIASTVSNPLSYSWLYYAIKGSISLNDIYGTEVAPIITGYDQHPIIAGYNDFVPDDYMLDIPYNHEYMKYKVDEIRQMPDFDYGKGDETNLLINSRSNSEKFKNKFPSILFYNISNLDRERLTDIWLKLEERELGSFFTNLIQKSKINDGGFLLEEKTAIFLEKLFDDILPVPGDPNKIAFFKDILSYFDQQNIQENDNETYSLEDIIEALNGAYNKFQQFLLESEIDDVNRKQELNSTFIDILKKQFKATTAYKVTADRVISILELNSKNGGSLAEQLEYLNKEEGSDLASNAKIYSKAFELGLNTVSHFLKAGSDTLLGKQVQGLFKSYKIKPEEEINIAFSYLLSVAPHQRASIDSYAKYYRDLETNSSKIANSHGSPVTWLFTKAKGCTPRKSSLKVANDLATAEYVQNILIQYPVEIYPYSEDNQGIQFYWSTTDLKDENIAKIYFLVKVTDNKIVQVIFHFKGQEFVFPFEEKVPNATNTIINYISNLYKASGKEYGVLDEFNIGEDSLSDLVQLKADIPKEIQEEMDKAMEEVSPLLTASHYEGDFVIGFDSNNFAIYEYRNGEPVKRDNLQLPSVMEKLVKEWNEGGQKTNYIYFSREEILGTFLEDQSSKILERTYRHFEENAARDANELRKSIAQSENIFSENCYMPFGVVSNDVNLVHDFTTSQALENLRLLALNIVSSSGKYYDTQYPDQEFGTYLSLFNLLFDEVKIKNPLQVGSWRLKVKEDYNKQTAEIEEEFEADIENSEVKYKEESHKNIISKFLCVFNENPEFKFGEVVALGLVANFCENSEDVIKGAKELYTKYNNNFYQLLRILISTSLDNSLAALEELKARAENIADKILFLTNKIEREGEEVQLHEIITEHGKYPENLVFFATCFGQNAEVALEDIKELLDKIKQLTPEIRDQILDSFALSRLPFANGIIDENIAFPKLSLDTFDDPRLLNLVIENSKTSFVSYDFETRFNDVSRAKLLNTKPDFSSLETRYKITFNEEIKTKTFTELKKAILSNDWYIYNSMSVKSSSIHGNKMMNFDFVSEMFASISLREKGWQLLHNKSMKLLFDPERNVSLQLSDLEYNKGYLDSLLQKCGNIHDKERLLDLLSNEPSIPYDKLKDILVYLNSISIDQIQQLGLSIPDFLEIVPKSLYIENISLFRVATDFILKNSLTITLEEFYQLISKATKIRDSDLFFGKILKYCQEYNEFSILNFIGQLNSKAKNFEKVIEWLTSVQPENLKKLVDNKNINFKQLFKINEVDKIKAIAEIALELGEKLSIGHYKAIIDHIKRHDLDEAKLLKSYLLMPSSLHISEQEKIQLVIDNLNSLEKAQVLFSEVNLGRFNYDQERLISKILEIAHKTCIEAENDFPLMLIEQKEIYKCFITVMEYCKNYKDLNYNELLDKSLELKHIRLLHKEDDACFIRNLDLEFVALSIEAMYRETGKFPRDTQILGVLNTLIHDNHLIAEIATGQGKSIIATLHAAYLWFTGQTVDVVTSSRTLGGRDLQLFSSFYDALGIKHGRDIITPQSAIEDYKKGGVNYALASDLALFRADREFHSNKQDVSLNTDVSIVCDEIDAILTSSVNYKLALPLINTNQEETRVLFGYILDFAESDTFKNRKISRKDDIENLKLFLNYQFEKYDSSLHFPLNTIQLDKLKKSNDLDAKILYALNQALVKCSNSEDKLFDKLLDSVLLAKSLEKGVHFVVLSLDEREGQLLKAIPIIKDQPSRDTVFGDGVQTFLHLLLERENSEWSMTFDTSPPTATIFNVSPKNFFDYYRLTDGRIIGLTGTAGNKVELEEFRTINKIVAFSIPKFEQDRKTILPHIEVENIDEQYNKAIEVLKELNSDRPVIIFCESTRHAEGVYKNVKAHYANVQLFASSNLDTSDIINILENAGKNGSITVTTPMLGRGTDFLTTHQEGYFAINLCTDITYSSLLQIYGRVARNGDLGSVVSIFNQDIFAENIQTPMEHMHSVANEEKNLRMRAQPLTDILKYFSSINQDNTLNAILTNEFITNSWKKLTLENDKAILEDRKTIHELQTELVKIVKAQYPDTSKNLETYLNLIDTSLPEARYETINSAYIGSLTHLIKPYMQNETCIVANYGLLEDQILKDNSTEALHTIPEFTRSLKNSDVLYVNQPVSSSLKAIFGEANFNYKGIDNFWQHAYELASSQPAFKVQKPINDAEYQAFYEAYIQINNVKMLVHTFTLGKKPFNVSYNIKVRYSVDKPVNKDLKFNEIVFSTLEDSSLVAYSKEMFTWSGYIHVPIKEEFKVGGISNKLVMKIKSYQDLPGNYISLNRNEALEIKDYFSERIKNTYKVKGEGSSEPLMLEEFKQSFFAYQKLVNSIEIDKISNLVINYNLIQNIDTTQLEYGKFQAINIVTKFTSESSHAESILINGKFLLWINRGAREGEAEASGIKIFKIIKDIKDVRAVLEDLKEQKSQAETRKAIYSLLREENDENIPEHVLVKMKPQKIGNCGWTQTKGMLKALSLAKYINELQDLPKVKSQEWQKAIKNADDIYKDFTTFDRIIRAEALLYTIDQQFKPKFLDVKRTADIDEMRKHVNEPVTHILLEELTTKLEETAKRYMNTIYEDQYHIVSNKLKLETAFSSEVGLSLENATDYVTAKSLLHTYQNSYLGDFSDLHRLYNTIKDNRLKEDKQDSLFKEVLKYIIHEEVYIDAIEELVDKLNIAIKDCAEDKNLNEECIIDNFKVSKQEVEVNQHSNEEQNFELYNQCYNPHFFMNNLSASCPAFSPDNFDAEWVLV